MRRLYTILSFLLFSVQVCYSQIVNERKEWVEDVPSQGALNAIMKAYQMTDIEFTTQGSFHANPGKDYNAEEKVKGLIYSSVKETNSFVGMDVSFHTFMTAIHNPRSVIYTEDVSKPPYHGQNCGSYYGTVCSGLVSYAFGLRVYQKTYDYPSSKYFQIVEDQSSLGVHLADVINSGGHVQLVTRIWRNPQDGKAEEIEICEAVHSGCRRVTLSGSELNRLLTLKKNQRKLYRYKYLDSVKYSPLTNFVAVEGEQLMPFRYNDDICTNRGDKSCYIVGDTVILNLAKGYRKMEIYKDSKLFKSFSIGRNIDVIIADLPFGDYKARLVKGKKRSEFTYWKVIDTNVSIDTKKNLVKFQSENALPIYVEFSTLGGGRPTSGVFELSDSDIQKGYIDVSSFTSSLKNTRYVKVHFECDYGRVISKPKKWIKR